MIMSENAGAGVAVPPLDAFEGVWEITRVINDRRAGEDLRFEGIGRFTPEAGGLRYSETGELLLPQGGTVHAERCYVFRDSATGIEVFFDDGRLFHRIPRHADQPVASHWCDPDSYEATYDFARWPDWTTWWTVQGPRKDYRMVTRYRRVQDRGNSTSPLRQ